MRESCSISLLLRLQGDTDTRWGSEKCDMRKVGSFVGIFAAQSKRTISIWVVLQRMGIIKKMA